MSNDTFRVVGRQIGLWAWQGLEMGSKFILPWIVAGGLARNTDPTLKRIQDTFRRYADWATNFRPVRWAKGLYQWVDGKVNGLLNFADKTVNRLNIIPGYGVLTGFPLFLGNWEEKYKPTKNYLVIGPLWQHTVQPWLKKQVFDKFAIIAASYMAPYADAMLRFVDENVIGFLKTKYGKSAADFGLQGLQNSFTGWWNAPKAVGAAIVDSDKIIEGLYVSPHGMEKLGEHHLKLLSHAANQTVQCLSTVNDYVGKGLSYVSKPINDLLNYGNCLIYSDKGAMTCSKSAYSHLVSDYIKPAYHVIHENGLKQTIEFLNSNGYTAPVVGLMCRMANDVTRYYDCVALTDKGLGVCTQSAISHVGSDYIIPAVTATFTAGWNGVCFGANFVWQNALKVALNEVIESPYTTLPICAGLIGLRMAVPAVRFVHNAVQHRLNPNLNQVQVILPVQQGVMRKIVGVVTGF